MSDKRDRNGVGPGAPDRDLEHLEAALRTARPVVNDERRARLADDLRRRISAPPTRARPDALDDLVDRVLAGSSGSDSDGPWQADPSIGDPKSADPTRRDPWLAVPLGERNMGDPKSADPNLADPKLAGSKLGDPWLAVPELADPNLGDPWPAVQELATSSAVERPRRRRPHVALTALAVAAISIGAIALLPATGELRHEFAMDLPRGESHVRYAPSPPPSPPPAPPPAPPTDESFRAGSLRTLRDGLGSPEPEVRSKAAAALAAVRDGASMRVLLELTEHDPDRLVRGQAADALGRLGEASVIPRLQALETAAPPNFKVWYASALARLGDPQAVTRLLRDARGADLAVAFEADLALARVGPPEDRRVIDTLRAFVTRGFRAVPPSAWERAAMLAALAALHDRDVRQILYKALESIREDDQLAAAAALARIGDDSGGKVLREIAANPASRNQLFAAATLIDLGDDRGVDSLRKNLFSPERETRVLAARAMGKLGDRSALPDLVALQGDPDGVVRIEAAVAALTIADLDPLLLAEAARDWVPRALASADPATRTAAAEILGEVEAKQAVPLLAQALADHAPKVRIAAVRSAASLGNVDPPPVIVEALIAEAEGGFHEEPLINEAARELHEQAVIALGAIGDPVARAALGRIADDPRPIGVAAAGALLVLGDASRAAKLEAAATASSLDLRIAAARAAAAIMTRASRSRETGSPALRTLELALRDRAFNVRFIAAESLASHGAEVSTAVPILTDALGSRDLAIVARARAALHRAGVAGDDSGLADEIDVPDPRRRLAALQVVRALPAAGAASLLRRLLADRDPAVRHASVDAIAEIARRDAGMAIKLYRPLVRDPDPVVRAKAAGRLAQLLSPSDRGNLSGGR